MTSCLLQCTPSRFQNGVYSIRKEFASSGSKFFPFRVDPFSEGKKNNCNRVASPESVSIPCILQNIPHHSSIDKTWLITSYHNGNQSTIGLCHTEKKTLRTFRRTNLSVCMAGPFPMTWLNYLWSFFYILYTFLFGIQNGCLANTLFALDPSNSVIKRLWWTITRAVKIYHQNSLGIRMTSTS